jgi:hypothetical protein
LSQAESFVAKTGDHNVDAVLLLAEKVTGQT